MMNKNDWTVFERKKIWPASKIFETLLSKKEKGFYIWIFMNIFHSQFILLYMASFYVLFSSYAFFCRLYIVLHHHNYYNKNPIATSIKMKSPLSNIYIETLYLLSHFKDMFTTML